MEATASGADIVERIVTFDSGRDPRLLARKYRCIAHDPFAFYRATAHLYYGHLGEMALPPSPVGWMCGDLHIENFGAYRADNGLVYFDQNDFDEGVLGPAAPEIVRLLASVAIGSPQAGPERRAALMTATAAAYGEALAAGKVLWCERETADGAIRTLLDRARKRSPRDFLDKRTDVRNGRRTLKQGDERFPALGAQDDAFEAIAQAVQRLAGGNADADPRFFEIRDIKVRVAGLGSLGLRRYAILVRGKGDPDKNTILDMKFARRSAARAVAAEPQPDFGDEATRIVGIMDMAQTFAPRHLTTARIGDDSFVVRRLQPQEDRLDYAAIEDERESVFATLGRIAAWAHLRSAGRSGAASPDAWIAYGNAFDSSLLIAAAHAIVAANAHDHATFARAWKARDPRLRKARRAR